VTTKGILNLQFWHESIEYNEFLEEF